MALQKAPHERLLPTCQHSGLLALDFLRVQDVLENIALSEFEKTAIAKERAKKRHKYHGLDDDEFTESGKSKVMLSKYDDFTVDGKKISEKEDRRSIRLGEDGSMDHTKVLSVPSLQHCPCLPFQIVFMRVYQKLVVSRPVFCCIFGIHRPEKLKVIECCRMRCRRPSEKSSVLGPPARL